MNITILWDYWIEEDKAYCVYDKEGVLYFSEGKYHEQ